MTADDLRALRLRLGLTQKGLAAAIGYRDPVSVSRWERGVETIPPVVALAVEHLACGRPRTTVHRQPRVEVVSTGRRRK